MQSTIISAEKHKQNLKELGRFGAQLLMLFVALFAAMWVNFTGMDTAS